MKNIYKTIIISAFVSISMSSCNDALDIVQDGELNNENTILNTEDMNKYLNGTIYTGLDITSNIFFSAQLTDELGMGPQNSELALSPHQFYVDRTNGTVASLWLGNYTTINRVNRLIESSKTVVPSTAADQAKYRNVLAQARLVRAFSYFTLLSYFSTDMKNPNALGVMLVDNVPELAETKPRVNNSEIFAFIDSDIAYAETNLSANSDYFRISPSFLNAFKARYYLYRGMYAQAKTAAQAAISGLSLTVASPPNPGVLAQNNAAHQALNAYTSVNPYVKMLNDTSRGEIIFALNRPFVQAWGNIGSLFASNTSTANGGISYDMGRKTFNLLASVPGDIRRYAYIDPTSLINANYATIATYRASDVLVIDKYPGRPQLDANGAVTGNQPLRNDLKVFRLSEMYFILAECAVEESNYSTAATLIKNVRDARNYSAPVALPVYTSKQQAYADILLERRKELYLEGHRYLDLKRLGSIANVAIDRDATDDLKTIPVTIPIDDYRMKSLPIPLAEIQGNPAIANQQNPGY